MGNYGCFPDCAENISKPLLAEVNINLIKRKPLNSGATHGMYHKTASVEYSVSLICKFVSVIYVTQVIHFTSNSCLGIQTLQVCGHLTLNFEPKSIQNFYEMAESNTQTQTRVFNISSQAQVSFKDELANWGRMFSRLFYGCHFCSC